MSRLGKSSHPAHSFQCGGSVATMIFSPFPNSPQETKPNTPAMPKCARLLSVREGPYQVVGD